jgi:hypothetical protein
MSNNKKQNEKITNYTMRDTAEKSVKNECNAIIKEKKCSKCGEIKSVDEYYKSKLGKYGFSSQCKKCKDNQTKKHRNDNRDVYLEKCRIRNKKNKHKRKLWREKNKDKIQQQTKAFYEKDKEKWDKINLENYYKNKEERLEKGRVYNQKNKKKKLKKLHDRLETDVPFKIKFNLRNRIRIAIKFGYKAGSAVRDLGCSIEECKKYIESQFQEGMTWDNWGRNGWYLDHKIPLALFDLTDREQFLKACHYTNLQPLWAKDNLSKGNKIL